MNRHALLLEPALGRLGDVGVLGRQNAIERLEQQHLDSEPGIGGGDLRSGRAGADDGHRLRQLGQRPCLLGPDHPTAELRARDRLLDRAGGQHDRLGGDPVFANRHHAVAGQRALALDVVDLVLLEQPGHAAGQRGDDLLPPRADGGEVDLRLADLDAEAVRLAHLGEDVGDAQDRLGRDAGVVQAAPADAVLFDDGGLHPELGGADRGHVAAGPRPDHHAVVSGISHQSEPS